MTNKKPFVKWVLHGIELPFRQNLIYRLSPTAALEQSLRAIWDAVSGAAVLILLQIKLNLQLSSCTFFFFKLTVMATMQGPWVDFLPSTGLHEELELWYQQWPLASIHLLWECRQMWVCLSWSWISHIGWDSEFYLAVEQVTCPLLVGKIRGGAGETFGAYPLMV